MISGEFNSKGELIFEIGLLAADGDIITVKALLDTGFTGLGGDELPDILLGVYWLQIKRLVSDFPAGVLTLG